MNYVSQLIDSYRRSVDLPWQSDLAPPQRVWMAVYPPDHERRIRLHLPEFGMATTAAGRDWGEINITTSFEEWMAANTYREQYFESPELLEPSMGAFLRSLEERVESELGKHSNSNSVVGLVGVGSLFGLGETVKASALINGVSRAVEGRLLVFFPGEHEGNSYRLLDARDGWNYLATPITAERRS